MSPNPQPQPTYMPTPITMYQTADGQLKKTLAEAVAHEKAVFVTTGLTPILSGLFAAMNLEKPSDEALVDLVETVSKDGSLMESMRKFFAAAPPAAKKATRRRKAVAKPAEAATTPAVPSSEVLKEAASAAVGVAAEAAIPTEAFLEAVDALAGEPIALPGNEEPTPDEAPPPPPAN